MSFIAGGFTATYGGSALGTIRNGFTLEWTGDEEIIRGDNLGTAAQDAVLIGQDVFVEFELAEWNAAGAQAAMWPWGGATGSGGTLGRLASDIDEQLILTAIAGTSSAALTGEDVYTFPKCKLAEGFPVRILLATRLRTVPLRFRVYPDASNVYFTLT